MATYDGELLSPPASIIEADKSPRDAAIVLDAPEQPSLRVSVDPRPGIVRRSKRQ